MAGDACLGRWGRCDCHLWGKGGIVGAGALNYSKVGGAFQDVHWGALWPEVQGRGCPCDHGYQPGRVDDEVLLGESGDGHFQ